MITTLALVGAVFAVAAPISASPSRAVGAPHALPAESPGGECYKWKYPDKDDCGKLKGTTECKSEPTIESEDDDKKKAACKPEKGDSCACGDD